ncbi:MAG: hypothetical protein J0M24_19090 [Verrucomicrobia bacterium]|nr:hypothetical protein [Verrucomicrobiota bacterium]
MNHLTRLIAAGCLLATVVTATVAAPVTFQVDLSVQTALGAFNPATDGVFVAGDPLNGWSPTESPLTPSPGNPSIFVGTYDVSGTAGETGQYKFLLATGTGQVWEGNVGTGGGTGNRTLTISDTDQTLPVVYFNNVSGGTAVTSDVTFQVNMSVQTEMGNFNPESDTVTVAGEFNGWNPTASPLSRSGSDPNLWVGTQTLSGAVNSGVAFKFVMNGSTWEGNVGANGAQNRQLTLVSGPQTLPPVYFNNLPVVPSIVPLTFQVDLSIPIAQGTFDPELGTASVAGDLLNNWNPTASILNRSESNPNVWTGTFDLTTTAGAVLYYKFVLNGSTWEVNVGPNGADNRVFSLASTDPQTLPLVYFNNVNQLGPITISQPTNGQITITWTASPQIRLQTAGSLNGAVWQDVPNTQGQGSVTLEVGASSALFRLFSL